MNVAICFDKNFQKWATVCLFSLWEQHKNTSRIRLFIVTDIKYEQFKRQLKEILKNYDFSIHHPGNDFNELPTGYHFSIPVYWRLMLPSILIKHGVNKIIYLDVDTLILKPLSKLYCENLEAAYLGAALDISSIFQFRRLNLKQGYYINSGILLMNIPRMSNIDWISEANRLNAEGKIHWVDQDVLNIVLDGQIKLIDLKWNVQSGDFQNGYSDDVNVVHFTESGNTKPWNYHSKHLYLGVYNTYIRKSGFYWDYIKLESSRRIKKYLINKS